jgi:hypothetical protein
MSCQDILGQKYSEIAWQIHRQAKPTSTRTLLPGFRNNGDGSPGAQALKARADAGAAVALGAEREPSGLARSVGQLRSRRYSFEFLC